MIGKKIIIFLGLAGAFSACGPDEEIIVERQVAERVGEFRAEKNAECAASLLQKAEKTADSLLIQEAILALNDSLARMRPGRPFAPPPIPPIDSLAVEPLFEQ